MYLLTRRWRYSRYPPSLHALWDRRDKSKNKYNNACLALVTPPLLQKRITRIEYINKQLNLSLLNLYTKTLQSLEIFSLVYNKVLKSFRGPSFSLRSSKISWRHRRGHRRWSFLSTLFDVGTDSGTEGTHDSGTSGGGKFPPGDSALLRLDWGVTGESNWSVTGGSPVLSKSNGTVVTMVNSITSL